MEWSDQKGKINDKFQHEKYIKIILPATLKPRSEMALNLAEKSKGILRQCTLSDLSRICHQVEIRLSTIAQCVHLYIRLCRLEKKRLQVKSQAHRVIQSDLIKTFQLHQTSWEMRSNLLTL